MHIAHVFDGIDQIGDGLEGQKVEFARLLQPHVFLVDGKRLRGVLVKDAVDLAHHAQQHQALLQRLEPQERQIVVLHAVAGLKHREVAQLLEMPLSTVLSKYSRSLKKLKKSLEGDEAL